MGSRNGWNMNLPLPKKTHVHVGDLVGINRLTTDLTLQLNDLAEALHNNIASTPGIVGTPIQQNTSGIAGLVYESIRAVTRLSGGTADPILAELAPILDEPSSEEREAVLAVLNGTMGDYLATTGNPLAISMQLRRKGQPLTLTTEALSAAVPPPRDKVLILVASQVEPRRSERFVRSNKRAWHVSSRGFADVVRLSVYPAIAFHL